MPWGGGVGSEQGLDDAEPQLLAPLNIMDAVRWVLGENKASELRGESCRT